jgi:hypothetical protein
MADDPTCYDCFRKPPAKEAQLLGEAKPNTAPSAEEEIPAAFVKAWESICNEAASHEPERTKWLKVEWDDLGGHFFRAGVKHATTPSASFVSVHKPGCTPASARCDCFVQPPAVLTTNAPAPPSTARPWNALCPQHGTTSMAVGTACVCVPAPSAEEVVIHRWKVPAGKRPNGWEECLFSLIGRDDCRYDEHATATIRRKP